MTPQAMLVAHEWVAPTGGSEQVFEELLATFPEADALCLWNDAPTRIGRPVAESRLAKTALRRNKALALPFMPWAWSEVELSSYEVVLTSSHAFSHQLAARAAREGRRAYSYVHTPARYVWAPEVEQRGRGLMARLGSVPLRRSDRRATDERVQYLANSKYIAGRIERSWGVSAAVVYPPVDVTLLQSVGSWSDRVRGPETRVLEQLPQHFVLGASRLVDYKRLDMAIRVGQQLDLPVVIAGDGPHRPHLESLATAADVPVHFVGRVSDELLYALYQRAALFAFMPVEDFGIMPVEAMALGTPVVVNAEGGAAESVSVLRGGFAAEPDDEVALLSAARRAIDVDMTYAREGAGRFSTERFREEIASWVQR
ncbi:glycosyltransferase involved in cell wall biosynthesis [Nocardioides sp. J9]|uniref:glycosyltransferase n=1 Tax=Nocardioides sp. J9 TaxID=935844 RepID=UPI0011A47F57|nr:glycosyltransferase [Nocardioides sp. J9]TWG93967.1 glycosyltransferase involved in cell wall biosynthesis [Nocardioides sp. J9]